MLFARGWNAAWSPCDLAVNAGSNAQAGFTFCNSDNGVWLVDYIYHSVDSRASLIFGDHLLPKRRPQATIRDQVRNKYILSTI